MAANFPGPFEVEIFYVEGGITHKQRLNCDMGVLGAVGDPFSSFQVITRAGSNVQLDTALLAYLTVFRALFNNSTNFTIANLYEYLPNSYDKIFQSTYDINLLGTNGAAAVLNHQTILTFTTQAGGNMRVEALDDANTLSTRIPIRDAAPTIVALGNYMIGTSNWIIARDGTYPIGRLNSSQGQNEALFKARNR